MAEIFVGYKNISYLYKAIQKIHNYAGNIQNVWSSIFLLLP